MDAQVRAELMRVSRCEQQADLVLRGGQLLNVYSGETYPADVVIHGGRIAFVGDARSHTANETADVSGLYLAPGLVEPHGHPWEIYNPVSYAEAVLPLGITTVAADDLFVQMSGRDAAASLLSLLNRLPLRYLWLTRIGGYGPHVRGAPHGGETIFPLEQVRASLSRPRAIGLAELNRWLSIGPENRDVLEQFAQAKAAGKIVQGHTAGATYAQLNALVIAGIDSCHEAIRPQEVLDRLRLGLFTMLRHSSLRPDLPELLPALRTEGLDFSRLMLTTDGSSPSYIRRNGNIDQMIRILVENGIPTMTALQMATRNPAAYLRCDSELGGIAPGRWADILVLDSPLGFPPRFVYASGKVVAERGTLLAPLPNVEWERFGARIAFADVAGMSPDDLLPSYQGGNLTAIAFYNSVLTRELPVQLPVRRGRPDLSGRPDLVFAALVARDGRFITRTVVAGLVTGVDGFATSYVLNGHLLVLGRDPEAMLRALSEVVRMDGGFAVVDAGSVVWKDPLPVYGMMTDGPFRRSVEVSEHLETYFREHGYRFEDPAYSLFFLAGDFLPGPRLMTRGVVDGKTGRVITPTAICSGPPEWRIEAS